MVVSLLRKHSASPYVVLGGSLTLHRLADCNPTNIKLLNHLGKYYVNEYYEFNLILLDRMNI